MIYIDKLKKEVGTRELFFIEKLSINEDEKIGLIGNNGVGKTTLFRILLGIDTEYSGYVDVKMKTGLIVSGDSFIGDQETKSSIINHFDMALAVDMESAPIAQVCYQFGIPFIIIRSISDNANDHAEMKYDEFLEIACINSSNVVKLLLNQM